MADAGSSGCWSSADFVGAFAAQVATPRPPDRRRAQHLLARRPRRSASGASSSTSSCSGRRSGSGRLPASRTRSCSGASSRSAATRVIEFLHGLGIVDLTDTRVVPRLPRRADAVCRRRAGRHRLPAGPARDRPAGRARRRRCRSSRSSIALFIATLMVDVPPRLAARRGVVGGPHQLVDSRARHPRVSRADSGVEALPPGAVADHGLPEVARARQPAEPRLREGAGRPRDGEGSRQQDACSTRSPASSAAAAR